MIKILDLIHKSIALFVAFTVLICIDLPCKILSWVFMFTLVCVCSIIYPLIKHHTLPNFVDIIYDYSCSSDLIAKRVYKEWMS